MRIPIALLAALVASNGVARLAYAEVIRVEVARRVDIQGGRYELIEGRILFAVDPANRFNARIVDLERAPRNAAGKVEAWADFAALRPKNGPRESGRLGSEGGGAAAVRLSPDRPGRSGLP